MAFARKESVCLDPTQMHCCRSMGTAIQRAPSCLIASHLVAAGFGGVVPLVRRLRGPRKLNYADEEVRRIGIDGGARPS
jgi:hypothetical protein